MSVGLDMVAFRKAWTGVGLMMSELSADELRGSGLLDKLIDALHRRTYDRDDQPQDLCEICETTDGCLVMCPLDALRKWQEM